MEGERKESILKVRLDDTDNDNHDYHEDDDLDV